MRGLYLTFALVYLLTAFLVLLQPWLTRKNVLFGVVFGSSDVWSDKDAVRIRRRYLLEAGAGALGIGIAAAVYFLLCRPSAGDAAVYFTAAVFAAIAAETVAFVAGNRRSKRLKSSREKDRNLVTDKITVETSVSEKEAVVSAAWLLLLLPVPVVTLALTLWGYDFLPDLLPTHYGFSGADAWTPKSWGTALMPVILQVGIGLLMLVCAYFTRRAPASVRGNPEAAPGSIRYRRFMVLTLILLGIVTELTFLIVTVGFFRSVPAICFNLSLVLCLALTVLIFVFYYRFVRVRKPSGPIFDDDAKWVLGMFYFSPSDPSLFVEKRSGIGYTVNFARPGAWAIMILIAAVVVSSILLSKG
ncbi:DUF5808 domain-containing protein [Papillibacter cinnamivorans]|uniref:Uncharacterized membrane protein n=1 Tax=Papillibacter cinnamivorans DSM 12816 TaxID=1122930 RepID=A0A1W2C6H5_9FIRM|nr:DUF5808 domain-containing protein [Papillibacter cinnamivorans]SMC80740.1 Uncharacterized membrane protein [Papillibacter cinnamivorans DSM 12816]